MKNDKENEKEEDRGIRKGVWSRGWIA
jgi:hypothetical protein